MRKKIAWMLAIALVCTTSVFTSCKKDPKPDGSAKKALLIILDGWGIGDQSQSDAIAQTAIHRLPEGQLSPLRAAGFG